MIDLVMIGAGGFGREALDAVEAVNRQGKEPTFRVIGVADDGPQPVNLERLRSRGYAFLGGLDELNRLQGTFRYLVGIGDPHARKRVAARCETFGWKAATVVHPSATVGSQFTMGEGSIVCSGVQISTNVSLGRHVHLNPAAVVGHDSTIGDWTSVNPAAVVSGDVSLEELVLLGAGAVILQGLAVGAGAVVGASACVTRDVDSYSVVVGVPARSHGGEPV